MTGTRRPAYMLILAILPIASSARAQLPVSSNQPLLASEFPARILAAHNRARAEVGAAPLAWDPALAAGAAQHAVYLARTNSFDHSIRATRPGIGENLWMGTRRAYSVEAMIGGWLGERRYFRPGVFPGNSSTGNWLDVSHYTAMIWPTTTRVGCAVSNNARSEYLVCRYSPKGNIDGRSVGVRQGERG